MNTTSARIAVGHLSVDVEYKQIKNLHVAVYPPEGRVRVAAPVQMTDDHVRAAVVGRMAWITRERDRLLRAERQSLREMVSGESHFVWGIRYRLEVAYGATPHRVSLDRGRLLMVIAPGASEIQRRQLLAKWYRAQLRQAVPDVVDMWAPKVARVRMPGAFARCERSGGPAAGNLGKSG